MEYDRAPSFWDYTELTRFATSEDKELRATGILQLASKALPLALRAGGGNEEPVRDGDREQQCCDAFHQLPTCTHANLFFEIPAFQMPAALCAGESRCYSLSRRQASAAAVP